MKYSLVNIFGFLITIMAPVKDREIGCNCSYKGSPVKVKIIFGGKYYKLTERRIEERLDYIYMSGCKLIHNDTLELKGIVEDPYRDSVYITNGELKDTAKGVSNTFLLRCINSDTINSGIIKVMDTLAKTDKYGKFSIKTIVQRNAYIVVYQNDSSGLAYNIKNFSPL